MLMWQEAHHLSQSSAPWDFFDGVGMKVKVLAIMTLHPAVGMGSQVCSCWFFFRKMIVLSLEIHRMNAGFGVGLDIHLAFFLR